MIIYPGLIASTILMDEKGNVWKVWLWNTTDDMKTWDKLYGIGDVYETEGSVGCHSPNRDIEVQEENNYIGDLHFVKDKWNVEVVAHEMLHGLFHYIRACVPDFARSLYCYFMEAEEEICYPFGEWVSEVHQWLWKHNPDDKWVYNG